VPVKTGSYWVFFDAQEQGKLELEEAVYGRTFYDLLFLDRFSVFPHTALFIK